MDIGSRFRTHRLQSGAFVAIFGLAMIAACGRSTDDTCEETSTCAPSSSGGPEAGDGPIGDGPVVDAPEGCDASADPKDAPKCVVNEFGVFVDATGGADGNPGTKESPVKSITAALGKLNGKPRVYVCAGTYAESVHLTATASIYGGFACGDFSYTGAKPKIQPTAGTDYALDVAAANVTIEDVQLLGPELGAPNSIAVRAVDSAALKFIRAHLEGRVGAGGAQGTRTDITNFPTAAELKATAATGGSYTCPAGGGVTSGGAGAPAGFGGGAGLPALLGGAGGVQGQSCSGTGTGRDGASGITTEGTGATRSGSLTSNAWVPASGGAGSTGGPGQGGGGGQGAAAGGGGTGGGGGAGGCGGAGGGAGGGGGASIALLAINSPAKLDASELVTGKAGVGGTGSAGQQGQQISGTFGASVPPGCPGGTGGFGGNGGSGGGGAGGISVAVVFQGTTVVTGDSMITTGDLGTKGPGGVPGTNDGIDGTKADSLEVTGQ